MSQQRQPEVWMRGALLFHAAEHTLRHMGQMVTTIKIVTAGSL
jgi:uncharacterized damage-inducible protein DinB